MEMRGKPIAYGENFDPTYNLNINLTIVIVSHKLICANLY